MENDSNPQPQKTGGLKLMTVFIGVLALHVVVIGGITVYHLLNGGNSDADLVATDKTHKDVKVTPDGATVADGQLPDGTTTTKTAATESSDSSETPITIPQPPASSGDSSTTATATSTPAATPAPASTPSAETADASANPTSSPSTTAATSQPASTQPSGPIAQAGPVVTPPPAPSTSETVIDSTTSTGVASSSAAATDEAGGASTYTIKSGDTLTKIAHRHHIKLAALIAANNGIKSNAMQIGQKLTIPAPTTASNQVAASTETAAPADTPTKLDGTVATTAKPKHHHSEPNRTLLGDSPEITGKPVAASTHDKTLLSSGGGGHHVYTVMKGDTLNKIAHRFHTSPNAIMALNDISDAHKLRLGQKLRIPTHESRSATSAPVAPATPQQQQNQDQIEPRATPSAQLANFIN